ncbi:hypothetical protein PCANC_06216 [Puccinia coronata f. sp. avenae]|uniref:Uncharacterized protein n=1 Tax=Puccinia coronata f. sp. avenae TaxID=200324 RepID=A0A2N5TF30_9BASI|nr:hypothetical protein PCANC_17974 [Puccinia coronata f. sp. avenae]PLW24113.1 hypothetical protein PCASD_06721 [Puccinia coronata f. sp. avenae]PLW37885.1 hypothetical protein PCASD_05758 [Puccinia coronata f. sp. avenae]PLW44444.1 hypothetical protein PCANC_06216 [Puccinia coronata f. sp. avenae]
MPTVRAQMDKQGWHDSLGVQEGNASEQRIATVGLPPLRIAGQTDSEELLDNQEHPHLPPGL